MLQDLRESIIGVKMHQMRHEDADEAQRADLCGATRAAELLNVDRSTVMRLADRGALKPVPMDGARGPVVFEVMQVLELLAQRKGQS